MIGGVLPRGARACLLALLAIAASPAAMAQIRVVQSPDPRGLRELHYAGSMLAEELLYGRDAALLEDILYRDGQVSERRLYLRNEGRLVRMESRDGQGKLLGELRYFYDPAGSLLNVTGSGSYAGGSSGMLGSGAPPLGAWTAYRDILSATSYDAEGRPLLTVTTQAGRAIDTEDLRYGSGPYPQRSQVSDAASGQITTTDYDEAGRPVLVRTTKDANELSRTDYRYDAAGRLLLEQTRRGLELSSRALTYDSAGTLLSEEYRADGELEKSVQMPGPDRVEEHFRNGSMFVKVTFSNGRKIREDFYLDGALAWTREYQ